MNFCRYLSLELILLVTIIFTMASSKFPESLAVCEQREEMERLEQKQQIPDSPHDAFAGSTSTVPVQAQSGAKDVPQSSGSYNLHSPPPSYFDQPGSTITQSEKQSDTLNLVSTYGSGMPARNYMALPLRKLGYESRRQLGLHLDPDYATASNWKSVADRLGFDNLEVGQFLKVVL